MAVRGCEIRVDDVDGRLWIETPGTEAATMQLHAVLELGRQTPRPWIPFVVLCGENGSGRTALATRFMEQARRAVTCTLVDRAREARDAPLQLRSAEALQRERQEKADNEARAQEIRQRVRDFGHCPRICAPAAFTPAEELDKAIHAAMHGDGRRVDHQDAWFRYELKSAQEVVPTQMVAITHKPGASWLDRYITGTLVNSPGDRSDDPLRRTSMLFVDGADRLLALSDRERRIVLQNIKDVPRPVTVVLVGSPELASAVRAEGVTQTIPVPNLEDGPVFDEVVRLVFGECGSDETRRLHAATKGAFGPLLHIAGLRGLKPPYAVPRGQVLRLPAPV